MDEEFEPSPQALVRCLQVLCEEAACLSLSRTFAALQDAIATCREESEVAPGDVLSGYRAGLVH